MEKRLKEVIHILLSIPSNVKSRKNRKWSLGGPVGASRVSEGLVRASRALGGSSLFDFRGFSYFLSLDRLMRASEAWPLCAGYFCLWTEVISLNQLADLLVMEILEL